MKRNVISLAGKTNVISLPSSWCKKYDVKKGDELDVEERGNSIVVSTEGKTIKERLTINVEDMPERVIRWTLSGIHKSGFDEIEVLYKNKEQEQVIEEIVANLMMGFIVMEKSHKKLMIRSIPLDRLVLKSISKDTDAEFENALRRSFLVGLEIADESLGLIKENKIEKLAGLLDLEKQNNKLTNFCEKILNKRGHQEAKKTNFYYVIIWNMEKVVDDYKYIINHVSKEKITINKDTIELYAKSNNFFRGYYELFYKFDFDKLIGLSNEIKDLSKSKEKYFRDKNGKEVIVVSHLFDIISKCSDFSASYVAINTIH